MSDQISELGSEDHNQLSVDHLHLAQAAAGAGKASDVVLQHLDRAIREANLAIHDSNFEDSHQWLAYLNATHLYLQGNVSELEVLMNTIPLDHINCKVMKALLDGLRQFGHPNYQRDYFGILSGGDGGS